MKRLLFILCVLILTGCTASMPSPKSAMRPTPTPEMLIVRPTATPTPEPTLHELFVGLTEIAGRPRSTETPRPPMDLRPIATSALVRGNVSVSSDSACTIKGNVNSKGERIYHCPGWRDYYNTDVVPSNGDRWFCSEAEAQAAGFRRPKNIGRYEVCKP